MTHQPTPNGGGNNNNNNSYTTKVKKLVAVRGGRLESLLLPVLVSASLMPKREDSPIEEDLANLDIMKDNSRNKGIIRSPFNASAGQDLVRGFLKKEQDRDSDMVDLDKVPLVIKEIREEEEEGRLVIKEEQFDSDQHDSDDLGESGSDGEGGFYGGGSYGGNRIKKIQQQEKNHKQIRNGTEKFIATMLHAMDCR